MDARRHDLPGYSWLPAIELKRTMCRIMPLGTPADASTVLAVHRTFGVMCPPHAADGGVRTARGRAGRVFIVSGSTRCRVGRVFLDAHLGRRAMAMGDYGRRRNAGMPVARLRGY